MSTLIQAARPTFRNKFRSQRKRTLPDCQAQYAAAADFFDELNVRMDRLPTPMQAQPEPDNELNNKMETLQ